MQTAEKEPGQAEIFKSGDRLLDFDLSEELNHGIANALMIDYVLKFNSTEVPTKMGTFPQYDHPHTLRNLVEQMMKKA